MVGSAQGLRKSIGTYGMLGPVLIRAAGAVMVVDQFEEVFRFGKERVKL